MANWYCSAAISNGCCCCCCLHMAANCGQRGRERKGETEKVHAVNQLVSVAKLKTQLRWESQEGGGRVGGAQHIASSAHSLYT